jgi:divalent metal cation (Fe/Co/Zn/Cd) transporter
LGDDVEVESHIEPQPMQVLEGRVAEKAMQTQIQNSLLKFAAKEKSMKDVHSIRVRQSAGGIFVHYHCRFDPKMSVEAVHGCVDRVEADLQKSLRAIKRVIAHAEPLGGARHKL